MNILAKFPKHLKPRDVQKDALIQYEESKGLADVTVIRLPVASGKSAIAMTIAKHEKQASVIVPTNLLVDQYLKEFGGYLHNLKAKKDYYCSTYKCSVKERPQTKESGKLCPDSAPCKGCFNYRKDLKKARVMPINLANYYIYMTHRLHQPTLIVDEAHKLIPMLQSMAARRVWQHQIGYPGTITTREQFRDWANNHPNVEIPEKIRDDLNSRRPKFLFSRTSAPLRGVDRDCIEMLPLDLRDEPPFLWPAKVKRIVLMSATISRKDIEQLGLSGRKVVYIDADSPISSENRPVWTAPGGGENMSTSYQSSSIPHFIEYCQEVSRHHEGEKGLIHCTYNLSSKLQVGGLTGSRFLFHTKDAEDKAAQYRKFRESKDDLVLIACGMYEGLDLPYDAGRWQIVGKVPWPYLGEPATKFKADQDPEFYAWEAIKVVLQACGRICRTLDDYGITYIYDSTFVRLYKDPKFRDLFPKWFRDSVRILE